MNSFLRTSCGRIAFLALFLMFLPTSYAQDENAESKELQEAKEETKLAKEKRDKAVADKERREAEAALAITAKTKPLEGTIAVDDNVKVEGAFLAYEALDKVAAKIAKNTVDRLDKYGMDWTKAVTFVLTTSEDNTNAISLYWATMAQLKKAKKEYERIHTEITEIMKDAREEAANIEGVDTDAVGPVKAASLQRSAFDLLFNIDAPIAHHFQYLIARQLAHDVQTFNQLLGQIVLSGDDTKIYDLFGSGSVT